MINLNGNSYKICLFDTNALSNFLKEPKRWLKFYDKEFSSSTTIIAYSVFSIVEISDSKYLFEKYIDFFSTFPSLMLDGFHSIFIKELNSYDHEKNQINPVGISPMRANAKTIDEGKKELLSLIETSDFFNRKEYWNKGRKSILDGISSLTHNFKPKNKSYSNKEIELFVEMATLQQIGLRDRSFLQHKVDQKLPVDINKFPSIISTSYVVFYKFYPDNRKPILSDVYDIFISSLLPYVDFVITENNLCEIIRKIQAKHTFLNNLKYYSIKEVNKKICPPKLA